MCMRMYMCVYAFARLNDFVCMRIKDDGNKRNGKRMYLRLKKHLFMLKEC